MSLSSWFSSWRSSPKIDTPLTPSLISSKPTSQSSSSILTKESLDLILEFEVGGGESYYNKYLIHPELPGGDSTITIGVGVDLGFYTDSEFSTMWGSKLNSTDFNLLKTAVGMYRSVAVYYFPKVKNISISWNAALDVFNDYDVHKTYNQCLSAFPEFENLAPNCQGAIISLVFNRGSSVTGSSRIEMLNIKNLIPKKDYVGIAKQIRNMERIWKGTNIESGMTRRREAESQLVMSCVV